MWWRIIKVLILHLPGSTYCKMWDQLRGTNTGLSTVKPSDTAQET